MKKIIALILALTTIVLSLFAFTSCKEEDNTVIRVGYLTGPTGMGMAKLIHDTAAEENKKYEFFRFDAPNLATAALAAGEVDIICTDTSGARDYFELYSDAKVLAINTLSSLFLVTDKSTTVKSFSELEGKTIYTCKAGTPKAITEFLVKEANLNVTVSYTFNGKVIASPKELGALLTEGSIDIAVVPEPILTSSLLAIKSSGNTEIEYSIDIPLSTVWEDLVGKNTPLSMGCIIANGDFVENHEGNVKDFLKAYEKSIEFVNAEENLTLAAEYVAEAKIMGAAKPAESALKNLHGAIAYIDGKDMKKTLEAFYNALGLTLPAKEFYYD